MAENKNHDFESREYQIELYELGIEQNIILYLPTGSGKTYIAILLIKHFCNTHDVYKKLKDGGKRAFFLVNTVALVEQQKKHIAEQTSYKVQGYSGDMGVDFWNDEEWHEELDNHQVLVMTCQIYLDLIMNNRMSLHNSCLLIFDECHHGVVNHPMRQVMKRFEDTPKDKWPRVVGLTATLINRSLKPNEVQTEIKKLENTYMASIQTSLNEEMVKLYSTNPKEVKICYTTNNTNECCYLVRRQILSDFKDFLLLAEIEDTQEDLHMRPPGSKPIDSNQKKTNKRFRNMVEEIEMNMDDLGVFGGSLAVLAHMVQICSMLPNVELESVRLLFQCFNTDSVFLRKTMEDFMKSSGLSAAETIKKFSSDKVNKLFNFLKAIKPTDRVIIFVQRRFTAKVLYYVVNKASKFIPELKEIKCNYMVGYNVGNPFKDTRENYLQRKQNMKVLNLFNQGLLNVIIASNVVEEGVDITQCNYVVMFDKLLDFRSYTQSKGRARDKTSQYIIMVASDEDKFADKYKRFKELELVLKGILCDGKCRLRGEPTQEEVNAMLFANTPGLEPYKPQGPEGPIITALSAISLVNRYFSSLRRDKFTKVAPSWFIKSVGTQYKCFINLPMESKVKPRLVEGTVQKNKEDAKRSVAMEACKKLHKSGELMEHNLLPMNFSQDMNMDDCFTPNFDYMEEFTVEVDGKKFCLGTKSHKRLFQKKCAEVLYGCMPVAGDNMYVHVIDMKPTYPPPADNPRLMYLYESLCLPFTFALISSKRLPKLADFPLYLSTGELEAQISHVETMKLTQAQLNLISNFQYLLFDKVLETVKFFMIKDKSNTDNSYLIAPVTIDESGSVQINYKTCEELCEQPYPSISVKPSNEAREQLSVTDESFLGKVVSPWYRTIPAQKYIVTKVCSDLTEQSDFPNDNYFTYQDYFKDKYNIEPLKRGQPLIEVRAFSNKLKSIKPRAVTKQLKWKKEGSEEFDVTLVPEYCVVYPLDGHYWLKALLLPSAVHRISQLCLAEELRVNIAQETEAFSVAAPLEWKKLSEDESLRKDKEIVVELAQAFTAVQGSSPTSNQSHREPWSDDDEEPIDIERNIDNITILDIQAHFKFINKPLLQVFSKLNSNSNYSAKRMVAPTNTRVVPKFVEPPCIRMLSKTTSSSGPEQTDLMQALITAKANDFVSCERLETLGDSFLKFAVSLALFESQPSMLEGQLTLIKGKVVGNKNLYFCGKSKKIENLVQVQDFLPNEEWVSPGFCVEHSTQEVIRSAHLNPSALFDFQIPQNERLLGELGENTKKAIGVLLMECDDGPEGINCPFINQQALTDKNISDCVEAILGVYLKNCGIKGALSVMNYFQVMNTNFTKEEIFSNVKSAQLAEGNPNTYLEQPHLLEEVLHYKFHDRSFMLQALTHSTYTRNNITCCYQRLEFLGDAIIDFLITMHIFEKCTNLSPGDLTDLRSALVNNITLACITVRLNLHKDMLYQSALLNQVIQRFVRHQNDKNHIVDKDVLFLLEESECKISEAVDVPKALGDVFEAIIGAIYLDSGKNLEVTWNILYNLMRDEIDSYCSNIPKNHVRMLHETDCDPIFTVSKEDGDISMAAVEVVINKETKRFNGFGENKRAAKRAAAKHALRAYRQAQQLV